MPLPSIAAARRFDPAAHLPPAQRGILAEPTPQLRQRIRDFLLRALSRY